MTTVSGKTLMTSLQPLSKPDEEYVQISRLGKGSEGYVYLCQKLKTGELFAMKKIEIEDAESVKKDKMLNSLLTLKNERILQHYEYYISTNIIRDENFTYLCIIMDLCNAGNLKYLMKSFDFSESDIVRWILQISEGLSYLHSMNFCHRDIKPENILLKLDADILDFHEISWTKEKVEKLDLKISDFGVTKQLGSKLAGTRTGTLLYMAPEVLSELGYDTSADIWSVGMLILESFHEIGLNKSSQLDALMDLRGLLLKDSISNLKTRYALYKQYSMKRNFKLCILLFECLCYDPEQRPTSEEILLFLEKNNESKFIRNNPLKITNKKLDTNPTTIMVTTDNTLIQAIHNVDAKNFWKKYFGENILEVVWRSFSGAYQTFAGRIGVTRARGLKKLLCGDSEIVTIYQFIEVVENSGFPFPSNLLEKIEKFTDPENEFIGITSKFETEEVEKANEKYLTMIVQYDKSIIDLVHNTTIDLDSECIPLQLSPIINQLESENTFQTDFMSPRLSFSIEDSIIGIDALEFIKKIDPLRIVIFGDPSSGKTTLLKIIMFTFAKMCQLDVKSIVPVFVSVSLLTENYDEDIPFDIQCIRSAGNFKYSVDIEKFLLKKFEDKKVLLLIDGLDESCTKDARIWLEENILKLDKNFENSGGIIITSRVQSQTDFPGFQLTKILQLNYEMKIEISKRRGVNSELLNKLLMEPKYEAITRTPLYLSMLIELFKQNQKIPSSRSALYGMAIENMLEMHLKKMRRLSGQGNKLDVDKYLQDLINLINHIAYHLHTHKQIYFSEADITDSFLKRFPIWEDSKRLIDEGQLPFFIPELNRYKFSQLSFQEYFTSTYWKKQITDELEGNQLRDSKRYSINDLLGFVKKPKSSYLDSLCNDYMKDPWFKDTFCFCATELSSPIFQEFINYFLNQKRSLTSLTVVFEMLRERNCREKEPLLYKAITSQLSFKREKKKMSVIAKGLYHSNPIIRNIAQECTNNFQIDNEYLLKIIMNNIKNGNIDGEGAGIAISNITKKNSTIQSKVISELLNQLSKAITKQTRILMLTILEELELDGDTMEVKKIRDLLLEHMITIMNLFSDKQTILQAGIVFLKYFDHTIPHREATQIFLKRIFYKNSEEILEIIQTRYSSQRYKLLELFKNAVKGDERAYMMKSIAKMKQDEYTLCYMVLTTVSEKDDVKLIKELISLISDKNVAKNPCVMGIEALMMMNPKNDQKKEIVQKLLEIFENQSWIIRDKACDAIIQFGSKGDSKILKFAYKMLNSNVKYRAKLIKLISNLSLKDDKETISVLTNFLQDTKFDVKNECLLGIAEVCSKVPSKIIETIFEIAKTTDSQSNIRTILKILPSIMQRGDKDAMKLLTENLNNSDSSVRIQAIYSIGLCSNFSKEIIEELFEIVKNDQNHIHIRGVAANSITEITITNPESTNEIISEFISLFKNLKNSNILIEDDIYFGSKWSLKSLGATSENDIIFTQINKLIRLSEKKISKWALTNDQIETLTEINCLESNFILLGMNKDINLEGNK